MSLCEQIKCVCHLYTTKDLIGAQRLYPFCVYCMIKCLAPVPLLSGCLLYEIFTLMYQLLTCSVLLAWRYGARVQRPSRSGLPAVMLFLFLFLSFLIFNFFSCSIFYFSNKIFTLQHTHALKYTMLKWGKGRRILMIELRKSGPDILSLLSGCFSFRVGYRTLQDLELAVAANPSALNHQQRVGLKYYHVCHMSPLSLLLVQ